MKTEIKVGDMRANVRFERRSTAPDGYGNTEGEWATLIERRWAKLEPRRGGETVIAQRLQGTGAYDLWVRSDSETRAVRPDDRVVDNNTSEAFNIRFVGDLDRRRTWLLMQLESGVAT